MVYLIKIVHVNFLIDGVNCKLNKHILKFDRLTVKTLSCKEYILTVHERFLINNKLKDLPYYSGTELDLITFQSKPRYYLKSGRQLK